MLPPTALLACALALLAACSDGGDDKGTPTDSDGDGVSVEDGDCDDAVAAVAPGLPELCDGADNDCDGEVDEDAADDPPWYGDGDEDGYGEDAEVQVACEQPAFTTTVGGDCDDEDAAVSPGATEICDELDNDCDGRVDEDVLNRYFRDDDGDGYGQDTEDTEACDAPSGTAAERGDCDDADDAISPAATEVCDDVDNDCDGHIDEVCAGVASVTYSYGKGHDTWERDCQTFWSGSWLEAAVDCEACDFSFRWSVALDRDRSYDEVDKCPEDASLALDLGFVGEYGESGTPAVLYYAEDYAEDYGGWYARFDASFDEGTGALAFWGGTYGYEYEPGHYFMDWWTGAGTPGDAISPYGARSP